MRSDFPISRSLKVPLAGFAQIPLDSRSGCIVVLAANQAPKSAVEQCKLLGAPIVLVCYQNTLQWWKQCATSAEFVESIPADHLNNFFEDHKTNFSPQAVYRAKTLGRVRQQYQLSFVDLGLMPLLEEEVGQGLSGLIERTVSDLKSHLKWHDISVEQGHWLLKSIFWLVSGKILRDKQVPNFIDLNLSDIEEVFARLASHYGTPPISVGSKSKLAALEESAKMIDQFASLSLTTTESLAHVYENTLISKETRSSLGTHSTPSFLVDYILGNLEEWISEIPETKRSVFEPACGQAAFLVAAMRLLTQLLPAEKALPNRRGPYLRDRLHGVEFDSFAVELARLSLTLSDIPNPDGWDLRVEDMFVGNRLAEQTRGKNILLANPPFEKFTTRELEEYAKSGSKIAINNKAAETLRRTLPELQPGSVFGLVVPQSLLHGTLAKDLRRYLVEQFELREISLFPDKVFTFSDSESAVLLGRRVPKNSKKHFSLTYRQIREKEIGHFRESYEGPKRTVKQHRFNQSTNWDMRVPDLEEVWEALDKNPMAEEICELMQGFTFQGKGLPKGDATYSEEHFPEAIQGFVRFESGLEIHALPKPFWMNLSPNVILCKRSGTTVGIPQVLLNYARVSRGPWRLKALIDKKGRPVTSNFITVRSQNYSLEVLWALFNSPVANAYAYTHLGKRHNLVGTLQKMPVPRAIEKAEIENAANSYLQAAKEGASNEELQSLLLRVDATVIRQYALPVELETDLLALFNGWPRVGVPFQQNRYFPEELTHPIGLANFLQYESDWPSTNRRRGKLIDKELSRKITRVEIEELEELQAYADYYVEKISPRPTKVLKELESKIFGGVDNPMKEIG